MRNKDRCSFCKGNLYEGKTEFVAKVGDEVISIKEVPAYVCENCGEAYFTPEISRRKIDELMTDFHGGKLLAQSNCSRRSGDKGLRIAQYETQDW